ncbi:MAG: CPBP family intramembrane metalloprotease [Defluviitaleaceae bacterium]|nr:CPBP family intramembrane metalloprotease [Defluviitaleaceae bacterium]
MTKKLFSTDESYKQMIKKYNKVDGFLVFAFFALYLILLYLTGQVLIHFNMLITAPFGITTAVLVFVLVRIRKQTLKTIGITKSNFLRSSLVGLVLSMPLIIFNVVPEIIAISQPIQPFDVLYSVFFYLIVISFSEEIIFRGYIQPRLHGLIKYDFLAIAAGGIMFSAMHIPFQAALYYFQNGKFWPSWITPIQLLLWFGWHVVFNIIYRKYNSLAGPVILHFFMNFTIIQAVFFI